MNNEQFDAGRRKKNIGTILLVIGIIVIVSSIYLLSQEGNTQSPVFAIANSRNCHPLLSIIVGIIISIAGGKLNGTGKDMQTKAIHNTDVPNNQQQSLNNGQ